MLKIENGLTEVSGTITTISTDLTVLVRRVYKLFSESMCKEEARQMVMKCFDLAMKTEKQIHDECMEMLEKLLKGEF